jgi:hypothetical protein
MDGRFGLAALALSVSVTAAAAADCRTISENEVMKAELARYEAQTGNDFMAMERIIGDDLVYIHSSALRDDKASYIAALRSGTVKYRTMRMLESKIRIYDCLAIMTGTARFEVTVKGDDISVDLRFTEAWVRRGDNLQFVSWQATRIPLQQ